MDIARGGYFEKAKESILMARTTPMTIEAVLIPVRLLSLPTGQLLLCAVSRRAGLAK